MTTLLLPFVSPRAGDFGRGTLIAKAAPPADDVAGDGKEPVILAKCEGGAIEGWNRDVVAVVGVWGLGCARVGVSTVLTSLLGSCGEDGDGGVGREDWEVWLVRVIAG